MKPKEVLMIMEQLEGIGNQVNWLREKTYPQGVAGVEGKLISIWEKAHTIQRYMARPEIVAKYRQDAMEQVLRVNELLFELGTDPDDIQMASVGYACDLAQELIKTWQRMSAFAAKTAMLTGVAALEEETC